MQLTFNHAAQLIHKYWHHGMLSRYMLPLDGYYSQVYFLVSVCFLIF